MYHFSKVYNNTTVSSCAKQIILSSCAKQIILSMLNLNVTSHLLVARAVQTIMVEFDHNMPVKAKQRT